MPNLLLHKTVEMLIVDIVVVEEFKIKEAIWDRNLYSVRKKEPNQILSPV